VIKEIKRINEAKLPSLLTKQSLKEALPKRSWALCQSTS